MPQVKVNEIVGNQRPKKRTASHDCGPAKQIESCWFRAGIHLCVAPQVRRLVARKDYRKKSKKKVKKKRKEEPGRKAGLTSPALWRQR
jgi:hypothetical protein